MKQAINEGTIAIVKLDWLLDSMATGTKASVSAYQHSKSLHRKRQREGDTDAESARSSISKKFKSSQKTGTMGLVVPKDEECTLPGRSPRSEAAKLLTDQAIFVSTSTKMGSFSTPL